MGMGKFVDNVNVNNNYILAKVKEQRPTVAIIYIKIWITQ